MSLCEVYVPLNGHTPDRAAKESEHIFMNAQDNSKTVEFSPGLYLDLVLPESAQEAPPVIVWLHGGGWRLQDRTARPDFSRHFAERGFAMVSIDYRLAPTHNHPAQVSDLRLAITYLKEHAEELGIDAGRIGLWGSSAGGHVATMAALLANTPQLDGETKPLENTAVTCVVSGYGPTDIEDLLPDFPVPVDSRSTPEQDLLGGIPQDADQDATQRQAARAASPINQDARLAPPFLLMHGTADNMIPAEHSQKLHRHLGDAGRESILVLIEGFGHGFFNPGEVLELGPGIKLDNGRLEREPDAAFTIESSEAARFATEGYRADHTLVSDFFAFHLGLV